MLNSLVISISRRVMGMRSCDSRCLFSGSKGEVCSIEPLHAPPDFRDHPITHYSLLAMASLTKVHTEHRLPSMQHALYSPPLIILSRFCPHQILVIGLKPSLKVWINFPYSKVCIYLYLFAYAGRSFLLNEPACPGVILKLLKTMWTKTSAVKRLFGC